MVNDQSTREKIHCHHSFQLPARVLLYAPSVYRIAHTTAFVTPCGIICTMNRWSKTTIYIFYIVKMVFKCALLKEHYRPIYL